MHYRIIYRTDAIPIGYADGLNRHLGNGHAYCLVNGQRAPYVDVYKRQTIVKEWLHQLLSPERMITRSPRSYNSQIGVPLSCLLYTSRCV